MNEHYSCEGNKFLLTLEKADKFNNWMYSVLKPFLGGNILEVGSGIGTISQKIVNDFPNSQIVLSDIDSRYISILNNRFNSIDNVKCLKFDLGNIYDLKNINQKIDSVLAVNVLEHLEDDVLALNNIYNILDNKGKFIILIPAHKFLFNCIDKAIGHHRRYTKKEIVQKISKTKFKINKVFYFNFFSIFGWYIQGNILKKMITEKYKISLFNLLIPIQKFVEKYITRNKIGISLIVVLEKE